MTFEEFWNKNYEKDYGPAEFPIEPYYGIASYAWEMGQTAKTEEFAENMAGCQSYEILKTANASGEIIDRLIKRLSEVV